MLRQSTTTVQIETLIKQLSTHLKKGEMDHIFDFLKRVCNDARVKTKPDFIVKHTNQSPITNVLDEILEHFNRVKNEHIDSVKKQPNVNPNKLTVALKNVKTFLTGFIEEVESRIKAISSRVTTTQAKRKAGVVSASVSSSPAGFFQTKAPESRADMDAASLLLSMASSASKAAAAPAPAPAVIAPSPSSAEPIARAPSLASTVVVSGTPVPTVEDYHMVRLRVTMDVGTRMLKELDVALGQHQQLKNRLYQRDQGLYVSLEDKLRGVSHPNEFPDGITNSFSNKAKELFLASKEYAARVAASCRLIEDEIKKADEEANRPNKRPRSI